MNKTIFSIVLLIRNSTEMQHENNKNISVGT